jgi:hypothetical protein
MNALKYRVPHGTFRTLAHFLTSLRAKAVVLPILRTLR